MKIVRNLFRILVGIVFVFSGFVKGVDPLGTAFRIEDYFLAFGTSWASPMALTLSILFCTAEFVLGVSLLFNLRIKATAWILLPLMTYFTILTFFDAVYNLVPDCGCFGDAIKLTNTETFIKNLVLMVFVILIFLWRKKYRSAFAARLDYLIIFVVMVAFTGLEIGCVRHLPLIDFMDWKVGNRVNKSEELQVKFYVTYKNHKTGEEKEFLAPNYPWNDSTWMAEWEFKGQRVENPGILNGTMLKAEDMLGNDVTRSILDYPGYQFIFVSWDLHKTRTDAFLEILPFYSKARSEGVPFICLTNALPEEVRSFRLKHGTAFDYYIADDVVLKTMVRANPGLILLRDGIVVAKYNSRDIPDYGVVKEKYLRNEK